MAAEVVNHRCAPAVEKLAHLPCSAFARLMDGVLGRPPEPGTALPLNAAGEPARVRHPQSYRVEFESPCRSGVRCLSRQAWLELRQVLRSYQLVLPLRVTALATGGRRYLLVEVAP